MKLFLGTLLDHQSNGTVKNNISRVHCCVSTAVVGEMTNLDFSRFFAVNILPAQDNSAYRTKELCSFTLVCRIVTDA